MGREPRDLLECSSLVDMSHDNKNMANLKRILDPNQSKWCNMCTLKQPIKELKSDKKMFFTYIGVQVLSFLTFASIILPRNPLNFLTITRNF